MAYRCGKDRGQMMVLPPIPEQYVSHENPVRAFDAFVDALDFRDLGSDLDDLKAGNSGYPSLAMLKLLLYGYSFAVCESNDSRQPAARIRGAESDLGGECLVGRADAGYWDTQEIAKVKSPDRKIVVPSKTQAPGKEIDPFEKSRFRSGADSDCHACPRGRRLTLSRVKQKERQRE